MWQFAKGNITNEEAFVDQLVSPEVSYLIQHSASIDPGNSGGPLVVKDENSTDSYSVIGVNTWTINNRQNTFFAIPSKNFPSMIAKAKKTIRLKDNKDSLKAELIKQCKLFAAEINSDKPKWDKVTGNISYAFVGYKGWDSFLKMLQDSDTETQKQLETRFFYYSPMDAMRYSMVYIIWKKVYAKKEKLATVEYKGINIADEEQFTKAAPVRTNFVVNGVEQEIEWMFEHGHWRISNYDLDKYTKQDNNDIADQEPEIQSKRKKKEAIHHFGLAAFVTPYTLHTENELNDNFSLYGLGGTASYTAYRFTMFIRVSSVSFNNKMKNPPPSLTSGSVEFLHISQGMMVNMGDKK